MVDNVEHREREKVVSGLDHAACGFGTSGSSLCNVNKEVGVTATAEPPSWNKRPQRAKV